MGLLQYILMVQAALEVAGSSSVGSEAEVDEHALGLDVMVRAWFGIPRFSFWFWTPGKANEECLLPCR